ncbi:hypothetical protein JTB14_014079 [Gonioctena quinquepunctata]|nr:hypothetical protein JTB14_014079 [Gonioctena quinquepunctata]
MSGDVGNTGSAFAYKGWYRQNKRNVGSTSGNVKKDITFLKCKQTGHFQNKCPNKNHVEGKKSSEKPNAFSAVFLSGDFNKSDWFVDSGASVHLTANKVLLQNECTFKVKEIMVANKSVVWAESFGEVQIETVVNDSCFPITVKMYFMFPNRPQIC